MRGRERAELRSEAHHLKPTVHVGQQGITESLGRSLEEALTARELVKLQLGRNAPTPVKDAAEALAAAHGAQVIQVIGRTCTLYRHNPALEPAADGTPPWRR